FSVEVRGYLRSDDQSGVTSRMSAALSALSLPFGVKYRVAGTSELIGDSLSSLSLMLAISVFLIYAVMVIQFERFMQPLIIMASIPFCLIGVVLGLYLFGSSMSIIAMLAIIALGGTVVNNAIVMVDYTNQLRQRVGMELRDAILQGAATRLRPILMTAMTTLFGVLPMALAHGNGSEVYAPLGQAIFGGLLSSTVITLVLVPVLYMILEKGTTFVRSAAEAAMETEIHE
ncbi:MAG: efflux RND transporter permease subunit, partial [Spirochaetales bacterium]|nr:efflux RND transporter permease subunit [Spirochaetales bacterium]